MKANWVATGDKGWMLVDSNRNMQALISKCHNQELFALTLIHPDFEKAPKTFYADVEEAKEVGGNLICGIAESSLLATIVGIACDAATFLVASTMGFVHRHIPSTPSSQ